MVKIRYCSDGHPGSDNVVEVPVGATVMNGALMCNLEGVIAECGGNCSCGTCHVHVDPNWVDRLEPATPEELEILEYRENVLPNSRLSCQLVATEKLDGLTVRTPPPE
jgi:2Fe-2S ferredoxin